MGCYDSEGVVFIYYYFFKNFFLAAVHVIVATPGRIIDLMEKGIANVSQCQILVLDEADKLLSMDYQKPLDKLISFLPSDRQILLYSATFPVAIRGFMVSLDDK